MSYKVGDKVRLKETDHFVYDGEPGKIVEIIRITGNKYFVNAKYQDGSVADEGAVYYENEFEPVDVPSDSETLKELSAAINDPEPMFFHTPNTSPLHVTADKPGYVETSVLLPVAVLPQESQVFNQPLVLSTEHHAEKEKYLKVSIGSTSTVIFLKDLNKAINKLNT